MPCFGPLTAYRPPAGADSRRLIFDKKKSASGIPIQVPCGQCIGCKLERSRQWAMRCMHELRAWPDAGSSFLTLTYDNEHCPPGLVLADYQDFMKRLRWHAGPGIRFFGCGEYGDKFGRPHYHIILFNYRPPDTKLVRRGNDYNLYESKILRDLWPFGNHVIGDVSFDSCAYVARYCLKKITGDDAAFHYTYAGWHPPLALRQEEFATMSRRPGLGASYYEKYSAEIYAHDSVIINGAESRPPRYYDNKYEILDSSHLEMLKKKRRRLARLMVPKSERTSRRRLVTELVLRAKLKQKARTL